MGVGSFRSSGDNRSFLDVVSQCSRRGADRSFIVGPKEEFAPSRGAGRYLNQRNLSVSHMVCIHSAAKRVALRSIVSHE